MRGGDVQDIDVRDAETVASITAGESEGLAAAYDRYAPGLYAYCHSLLGEPAAVSDAVRDTFIVAAAELGGLGDPGRLRPWLYAVARNECRYRLRTHAVPAAPGDPAEAGEPADDTVDDAADAEVAGQRAAVGAALAALSPANREIIELNLRQRLEGPDLAAVLGVSETQAEAMAAPGPVAVRELGGGAAGRPYRAGVLSRAGHHAGRPARAAGRDVAPAGQPAQRAL